MRVSSCGVEPKGKGEEMNQPEIRGVVTLYVSAQRLLRIGEPDCSYFHVRESIQSYDFADW